MQAIELRDPATARQWLAQALWLQRIAPVRADQVTRILDWAVAIAAEGEPLPPLGFVADVGFLSLHTVIPGTGVHLPGWPVGVLRGYEDYVLGKLAGDTAFARAGDALLAFHGRDRDRGLAFVVNQMRQRIGFTGVLLSPATLKALRDVDANQLLAEGWQSLEEDGPLPLLTEMTQALIARFRVAAELLGPEDVFELEHRTAIAAFGQRVALRQVLQTTRMLEESLPTRKPRSPGRRYEVPTRIIEEDTYPVGGFASISTRGSIESLLHSQLAYMETDDRPDLFDIKFLRDELLYYSRDENSFLRRRRTFIFALYPELLQARFKDADLPYQRVILLLGLLHASIRKLIDWLNTESLAFEIVLIASKKAGLSAEKELLEVMLAEQIANGTVTIETMDAADLARRCALRSRRSLCHCLLASVQKTTLEAEHTIISRLVLADATPSFGMSDDPLTPVEADSAWAAWCVLLERMLMSWI